MYHITFIPCSVDNFGEDKITEYYPSYSACTTGSDLRNALNLDFTVHLPSLGSIQLKGHLLLGIPELSVQLHRRMVPTPMYCLVNRFRLNGRVQYESIKAVYFPFRRACQPQDVCKEIAI